MPILEKFPLDLRLRDLNLKRGKITRKDVDQHLKQLPDDSDNSEELLVYEEEVPEAEAEASTEEAPAEEAPAEEAPADSPEEVSEETPE